jgi:hypothetical protein
MNTRGKILRDTSAGAGLLVIDGRQLPFTLEGMWQSAEAPRTGMTVSAQLDEAGNIVGLAPVPEAQLAREQSQLILDAARAKGGALAGELTARLGLPMLVSLALLAAAWFALNTIVVSVGPQFSVGLSFWKLLGVLNAPNGVMASLNGGGADGAGLYGFMAVLALLGPAAPHLWADRRAHLGALLPLLFMIAVALTFYQGINNAMGAARAAASSFGGGGELIAGMQQNMLREAMRAVSLGLGFYLALAVSLYFAGRGALRYLAARAN